MVDNDNLQSGDEIIKKRWQAMPRIDWDGNTPLYSLSEDRLFENADDLESFCYDQERNPASLMLVICEPNYFTEIDPNEYYSDILPDENMPGDADLPKEIEDAFRALNEVIRNYRTPISWPPGKFAPADESVIRAIGVTNGR